MGGSGGGGTYSTPGKTLQELKKEQEKKEKQQKYDRDVNDFLNKLLRQLNQRDLEQIKKHLDTIKTALEKDEEGNDIESYIDLRYGGSVSKHTYADGLSDIDMLVNINKSDLKNLKPREVLERIAKRLDRRLPNTKMKVGDLALTVEFSNGHEIQLLPSIKTSTGNKIPKAGLNEWSNVIKPRKFAEKLTEVNKANGGKVIPFIKLFKNVNETTLKSSKLSGYHLESLALNAFKNPEQTPRTYKGMLKYFCSYAEKAVMSPVKDSTGQSIHVDGYLNGRNSIERKQLSQSIKMLRKKFDKADSTLSISKWEDLFD
ncbi:CBASS oligonucleotide cyclase [Virgibacillus kimchii]